MLEYGSGFWRDSEESDWGHIGRGQQVNDENGSGDLDQQLTRKRKKKIKRRIVFALAICEFVISCEGFEDTQVIRPAHFQ